MPLLPSHTLIQAYTLTLIGSSYLLITSPLSILNSSPLWLLGESMHIPRASFVPATPNIGNTASTSAPGATLQRTKSLTESIFGNSAILSDEIREVLALLGLAVFLAGVTQGIMATPLQYSKTTLLALAGKGRGAKHGTYKDENATSEFAEKVHTLLTAQALFLTLAGVRVVVEGALVAGIYLLYADRKRGGLGAVGGFGSGSVVVDVTGSERGVLGLLANRIVFAVVMGDMLFWGYIWTVLRDEARDVGEVLSRRRKMEEQERE